MSDAPVVGPGGCLLHIGLPKTATTAVQHAASVRREEMLARGVLYPGKSLNQSRAVSAVLDGGGMQFDAPQHQKHWQSLQRARAANPDARLFVSSELASGTGISGIEALHDGLGPDLHVVVTVRPFAAMLPSVWQQYVKQRVEESFDDWLARVLSEEGSPAADRGFWPRHSLDRAVEPWISRLGPERVSVVVADVHRPSFVFEAFESLLGLPSGLLDVGTADSRNANRGLTFTEVELLRRINAGVRERGIDAGAYRALVRFAIVGGLQGTRVPPREEKRLRLPADAAAQVGIIAQRQVDRTLALGPRVVGDLQVFADTGSAVGGAVDPIEGVPTALAADALACLAAPLYDRPALAGDELDPSSRDDASQVGADPRTPADPAAAEVLALLAERIEERWPGRMENPWVHGMASRSFRSAGSFQRTSAGEISVEGAASVISEMVMDVAEIKAEWDRLVAARTPPPPPLSPVQRLRRGIRRRAMRLKARVRDLSPR